MDARQPHHHPFTRPPERATPHALAHQAPPASQPPSAGGYHPAVSAASQPQPAVHAPFTADPYPNARRDPFLPAAAQHARSGSYGVHGPDRAAPPPNDAFAHGGWASTGPHHASQHHSSSGPPPPPPSMATSHNPPGAPPYSYEPGRRRSFGTGSPQDPSRASSHDGPPPPPSFHRPHMPPPSSPQQQQQHSHTQHAPRAPFPSYAGHRELPGLGPAHRPGSSMSISSIIGGGDTGTSMSSSQSQSSPSGAPTNGPAPPAHSMQPPSPRRGPQSAPRTGYQPFRRQPSPERHMQNVASARPPEGFSYGSGSPPNSFNTHGSPDPGRPLAHPAQPYKPMMFQPSRPYTSSPNDPLARDSQQPPSAIPPRPNSQPSGPQGPPEHELKPHYDGLGVRRGGYGQTEERRRTLGESHHARPNVSDILGPASQASADRDRPVTVQPVSHSVFSPPRDHRSLPGSGPPPKSLWRQSVAEDAPRETTEGRREEPSALYRGYGTYTASSPAPPHYAIPAGEDMVRGRSLDHLNHRVIEQYHAPPTSDPHARERLHAEQLSRSLSSGGSGYPGRSPYDPNKALLEANRRTGRASPLPQAVQGAQAQPLSIGKDPSIKSEFGRMFSGLGSGLGSTTPSRGSPMPQGVAESGPPGTDLHDLRLQRIGSQGGRKPKRVKDEEGLYDNESFDGRGTPSGRGSKRNKHAHQTHHHHHHAHPHHHHHHHHKPDEEAVAQVPSATATPFTARFANPPPNGNASHHHHHYHAAPHHHHHAPRPNQSALPLPSPKIPQHIHDIQSVLDEAAKYPRHRLGYYSYEAMTGLPKPNSSLDDQFSYASKPKPMPVFDRNPINSIITCRVHRYYLKPRQRQQIVLQRHLWGARIYRDDSDPIAAAIHDGWIRGEWDDTVDVGMLDPRITAQNDPGDAQDVIEKRPAAPITPPADMELQIDMLILPQVEKYAGTVEYGISSRKSKAHDGLSFAIQRIRWVEEGVGSRGQERTAAAMKRRLEASATLLSLTRASSGEAPLTAVNGMAKLAA